MIQGAPTCPAGWTCDFVPPELPSLPWWQGDAGVVVVLITTVMIVILAAYTVSEVKCYADARRSAKHAARESELDRRNRLAIEEQRTMQVDAARGNPETLKLIREMQK